MAEVKLTPAQAAAVAHRGGALLISAGAGSGKTKVLVERLLDRITRDGLDIDRFLIITYTRAAAAELRGRILNALYERLQETPDDRHLRRQTALLLQARIGTIHSFCASVLRENAHLCGVKPDFRQLEGGEEQILRREVLREVLQERYEQLTEAFSALADTLGAGRDDTKLEQVVLRTYEQVQSHPDPEAWLQAQIDAPCPEGDAGDTPWGALLLAKARAAAAFWQMRMLEGVTSLEAEPKLAKWAQCLRDAAASLESFRLALDAGWDAAAAFGDITFPRPYTPRGMGDDPLLLPVKSLWDGCKTGMKKLCAMFDGNSAELLMEYRALKPVTDALFALVRDFSAAYSAEKQRRGLLDFSDLEHLTLRLLTEADRMTPSAAAKTISLRFAEILVDEYQDCNRVQDAIFFAVSREGKNVTMVGDVKQSIYRFRLADPTIFLRKYEAYADDPASGEGKRILLSENFRSDGNILRAANRFFSNVMSPQLGDMQYGEAEALKPGPANPAAEDAFQLFVPELGEEKRKKAEPEAVADYVAHLLHSGMTVPVEGGLRPLEAGDIAILLRSTSGRDSLYAAALKKRGIPALCLKAADPLQERTEVRWALSLLAVTDNPRQDIPLLAALRSPVWHFTEEELARIRCRDRRGCFYEALCAAAENDGRCAEVLETLARWRKLARRLPADELIREICAETALYALAEAREAGSSANLDQLTDYARSFGQNGSRSLFTFLLRLREAEEAGDAEMKAVFGGGSGVTVTTIHSSKGLEYPVVILADLMKSFNLTDLNAPLLIHPELGAGPKWVDREKGAEYPTLMRLACRQKLRSENLSEELRVLYVAMTRPKQKLALFCSVADREAARKKYTVPGGLPLPPELLEDSGSMGEWILAASLAFGEAGPWKWLDVPEAAEAPTEEQTAEATEAVSGAAAEALGWVYPHEADTRLPSKLTATALRDTALAGETGENASELVQRKFGERDFQPPAFLRPETLSPTERGTAMHLAMQYADWSLCETVSGAEAAIRQLREKRMLTPLEADAADAKKLTAFVTSPLGKLLQSGTLHREFKFSLLAPVRELLGAGEGETLLQGVVDCWSETPDGILLVDYKTDRVSRENLEARAAEYAPQLQAYAWALTKITGKPVLRTFLWFFAADTAVEI